MDTDTVCRQRLWSYDLTALYKSIIIIIIIIIWPDDDNLVYDQTLILSLVLDLTLVLDQS